MSCFGNMGAADAILAALSRPAQSLPLILSPNEFRRAVALGLVQPTPADCPLFTGVDIGAPHSLDEADRP